MLSEAEIARHHRGRRPLVIPKDDPELRIYLGDFVPSHDPRRFTPVHVHATYEHDPYVTSDNVQPIYDKANERLYEARGIDLSHFSDIDLIDMAFPDWTLAAANDDPPETRKQVDPYAVLRDPSHPDRWMLVLGFYRLCPGRGGLADAPFYFRYHSNHNLAVVGSVDEVLTGLKKWRHPSSWQHTPRHVADAISGATTPGSNAHREAVHHRSLIDLADQPTDQPTETGDPS